ncbi:RelA/SpoT family protein [Thioalkalivibrio paradoxus]|uniref:GTP pyrophosphokinase n=1 Tax=Thioalkalivibrio paradoxus ARh 1 TaxID=713585 RepID=W0DJI6_9GAMM|nr:bifunctional (p)ppGpp synthetase/guanosine-3',5'-bis(diphosphate) 3'-pyrophosphohydrolase [Thioalkalivibrio paradoxus]AHE98611.1 GTP pyrophosphokinase [Thioalkalivibrio paradoxus ARh 1]
MRHSLLTDQQLQGMERETLVRHFSGSETPDVQISAAIRYALDSVDECGLQTHPLDVAEILRRLNVDRQTLIATLLIPAVFARRLTHEQMSQQFGEVVARLTENVSELVRRRFESPTGRPEQAERLRRMLLAMVDDVRALLIKFAFRLQNLRLAVKQMEPNAKLLAQETLDVIAPLANRLGIGSLKWEMEDLSLRILEPDAYRAIANGLDANRRAREAYVEAFTRKLETALKAEGVQARVYGRPKHIYSIWRKMQKKQLALEELTDLRATRVIVDDLSACYTVLGIVHNQWPHLPREFDDYIANPKDNGYQSLHTAVIGPEGKVVEVQIRTRAMHEFAELGVAAHWRYKEGGREDLALARAINSLRQLLESDGDDQNLLEEFQSEMLHQRVFVLTPRGEVLDLPAGATPLDFAYGVHTEVGHRCRGAKVDGRIVPLTYRLRSGQRVEILTTRQGGPSRDWLNPALGYLHTTRARNKARSWFRQQNQEEHLANGRNLLDRECQRLGVSQVDHDELATKLGYRRSEDMLVALGAGDLTTSQVAQKLQVDAATPILAPRPRRRPINDGTPAGGGDIHIRGVGGLLTTLANCCKPVPGDAIIGFITRGKGVSVHRRDCVNVLRLPDEKRSRLIAVSWGQEPPTQAVDLLVDAQDRPGLLRDISNVFANANVNLLAVQTRTDPIDRSVRMELTAEVESLSQLSGLFDRIQSLANVYSVHRRSSVANKAAH